MDRNRRIVVFCIEQDKAAADHVARELTRLTYDVIALRNGRTNNPVLELLPSVGAVIVLFTPAANVNTSFIERVTEISAACGGRVKCMGLTVLGRSKPVWFPGAVYADLAHLLQEFAAAVRAPAINPPDYLVDALLDDECILFAGSGFSIASGLPSWSQLTERLVEWAGRNELIDWEFQSSLRESLAHGEVNVAAEGLVQYLKDNGALPRMAEAMREILAPAEAQPNLLHQALSQFRFAGIFTTNYDDLMERSFAKLAGPTLTPFDEQQLLDLNSKKDFFVLRLHGTLEQPETLVMAPALFRELVDANKALRQFMQVVFTTRTLLFLGTSLESIESFLESFRLHGTGRRHFALVPDGGSSWKIKADLLRRRYGLDVHSYPAAAQGHGDFVGDFLQQLKGAVAERRIERKRRSGPTHLARVELTDIGMFRHMVLDLDSRWNLLLGDNGVGKSTVLRAIAAGLCGEDCERHAEWLLRKDSSSGTITLVTSDGDRFDTVLRRTTGKVEVEVFPVRAIDAEGWLTLGFPPGRQFTWQRPQGALVETKRGRADGAELLPLLDGFADARPDSLKQWILTLDYQIKDLRSRNESTKRPEYLLRRTFDVIGALAAGLKVKFNRVEVERREIIVTTDDGDVPIECLSQGTASLLGWVGVLIHRISTWCPDDQDPCQQHAIVLVDEIESHMHPAWQQHLVHQLSKLFPNVQFIASSHSPLVAAGMPVERIIRLKRGEEGAVERLSVPEDMSMGRADQVLTSRLFDLDTTLDPQTVQYTDEYRVLLGKSVRTEEEEARFQELRGIVRLRIPMPPEGPVERRALQFIEALLKLHWGDDFPDARVHLLKNAADLFDELGRHKEVPHAAS